MDIVRWIENLLVFAVMWTVYSPWLIAEKIRRDRSPAQPRSQSITR